MKKITYWAVFIVVVFFVGIAITDVFAASPPTPSIEERFANQQKRINEGIKSGALTRDEAKILSDNLNYAQQEQKRLAEDGKLTEEERTRLHKMLDQNSKMIEDKKNNPVTAMAPQIHQRIANQQKRINEGIKSGKLTQDESKTLLDNLNYIQQEEKRLAAAGKFTQADKERLNKILAEQRDDRGFEK